MQAQLAVTTASTPLRECEFQRASQCRFWGSGGRRLTGPRRARSRVRRPTSDGVNVVGEAGATWVSQRVVRALLLSVDTDEAHHGAGAKLARVIGHENACAEEGDDAERLVLAVLERESPWQRSRRFDFPDARSKADPRDRELVAARDRQRYGLAHVS